MNPIQIDPDEVETHRAIARELESKLDRADWWLWLTATRDEPGEVEMEGFADEVQAWLNHIEASPTNPVKCEWQLGPVNVVLTAWLRQEKDRGVGPLVANAIPTVAGFPNS